MVDVQTHYTNGESRSLLDVTAVRQTIPFNIPEWSVFYGPSTAAGAMRADLPALDWIENFNINI